MEPNKIKTQAFDLEAERANMIQRREKEEQIATTIADLLIKTDQDKDPEGAFSWSVYQLIGEKISPTIDLEFSLMHQLYAGFLKGKQAAIVSALDAIWVNQNDKADSYGDADIYVTKIKEDEFVRVLTFKNVCTCAEENYWIVIQDLKSCRVHFRFIYERGDYPRATYPKKLTLRFWKDRNYSVKFEDRYHLTKLGSVYGDARDKGYILSFCYGEWGMGTEDGDIYYYPQQKRVLFDLFCVADEAKEKAEKQ